MQRDKSETVGTTFLLNSSSMLAANMQFETVYTNCTHPESIRNIRFFSCGMLIYLQ